MLLPQDVRLETHELSDLRFQRLYFLLQFAIIVSQSIEKGLEFRCRERDGCVQIVRICFQRSGVMAANLGSVRVAARNARSSGQNDPSLGKTFRLRRLLGENSAAYL